jgi:hypothetical protein
MSEPIENEYFNWLCAKVLPQGGRQYYGLLRILYRTPFGWVVSGDENREEDGRELRLYFLNETHTHNDRGWYEEPCSVFEMLLAFAQRAYFQTDRPAREWFWEFITNLDLGDFRQVDQEDIPVIEERLNVFVSRTYEANGYGGLFPMQWPKHDERKVEIWYQFCDYLDDRGLI